jgi:hypothetical protein
MRGKPLACVVPLEIAQELETGRCEMSGHLASLVGEHIEFARPASSALTFRSGLTSAFGAPYPSAVGVTPR